MEFAIGKILFVNSDGHARIEPLYYQDNNMWVKITNPATRFPNAGKVFAPQFKQNHSNIKADDIVWFNYEENHQEVDENHDRYVVVKNNKVWKCPRVIELNQEQIFRRQGETLPTDEEIYFFLKKNGNKYICGPIKSRDYSPRTGQTVNGRKARSGDTINIGGMSYLACDKNDWISCESDIIIDCISFDQLKTWFKAKIANEISREEINKILLKLDVKSQVDDIEEGRIKRVKKSLNALLSDWEDIKNLRPLDGFKETIDEIIEKNIDKVLKEENNKVKERRKEIEGEKEIIEISFKDYIKRNETEKGKLEKIRKQAEACKEELQKKEEELKGIETHQIELIESIRIQAGMVMSYPLESVCCATEAVPVTSENESEYFEKVNALIEDDIMQRQLLIKLKKYSAFKTNDIRTGIFLASVLGNSIYQLCQPSPKWIEFKNFWEESLRCIWVSAHAKPDVWHFLLIENYNLALPECWGKPLWNILEEKTMLLPFAKEPSYPNNLSIIVSQASTESEDNTHIGLPTAVAEIWPDINISFDCEGWSKFSDDKLNGLAVNEEYYLPVENE